LARNLLFNPQQRVDVTVSGSVQIFASYRSFSKPTDSELSYNLRETDYWQVNDPQIKALAPNLKPQGNLWLCCVDIKIWFHQSSTHVQRMGAVKALENPTQAICMDLQIFSSQSHALPEFPRAKINGYAYTEILSFNLSVL